MKLGGRDPGHRRRFAAWMLPLVGLLGVVPAPAQDLEEIQERIWEIQPLVGVFFPDDNINYDAGSPTFGLRASMNNSPRWALEGQLSFAVGQRQSYAKGMLESFNSQPAISAVGDTLGYIITQMNTVETTGRSDANLMMVGGSALFHLTTNRIRPFVLVGGGLIDDLSNSDEDPPGPFSNAYMEFGGGIKYYRESGWGFRLDIRDMFMKKDDLPRESPNAPLVAAQFDVLSQGGKDNVLGREPYAPTEYRGKRWLHNLGITVSMTVPLGWVWKDRDGDLVADRFDDCLTTAPGVVVNTLGCGIDTDEDGVFNGLDQCEKTPIGATVDLAGCPSDTDGDGVYDGLDLMDDTPTGARIDAQGRHFDTDGDGVFDGLDLCEGTPVGASINLDGCSENPLEERLLLGETILVDHVEFENGTDEIEPLSFHYVNKIARLIEHWTGNDEAPLRVEVGVHTDGIGSDEYNLDLSQRQADRIRIYMLENFFGMAQNNLVAVGYGESMPVGDDDTEEGRQANRRLEIRGVGPGDPPEEYDWGAGESDVLPLEGSPGEPASETLSGEVPADETEVPEGVLPPEPELPSVPDEPELPEPDLD